MAIPSGEYWVAMRADERANTPDMLPTVNRPHMGKIDDPFDASSPTLFSAVMNNFAEKTTIHLGPGIFQTHAKSWLVKSGQRIVGAGMYATTVKVVGATDLDNLSVAITHDPFSTNMALNGFEASDFTVDCNMRGHQGPGATVSAMNNAQGTGVGIGAISLFGRRIRIRRIRAVDFCTEGGTRGGLECFVIIVSGHPNFPDAYDNIVEDCLIERPSPNGFYNSTGILIGGQELPQNVAGNDPNAGQQSFARHCVIRDCVIDGEYKDNPAAIAAITYDGSVATVVTKTPHGRRMDDWIVITGALVDGIGSDNPFNGSFKITSIVDRKSFQFSLQATATAQPTGEMWLGKRPSHMVGIRPNSLFSDLYNPSGPLPPAGSGEPGITVDGTSPQWTVSVRTQTPHFLVPGNSVAMSGVDTAPTPHLLNGLFIVSEVSNPNKFKFITATNPQAVNTDQNQALINPTIFALGNQAGVGALTHNNRVFEASKGYYQDTYVTKDTTIKKNVFHGTHSGVIHTYFQANTHRLGSLSAVEDSVIATYTTEKRHTLEIGQAVTIGGGGDPYDGVFEVVGVPSATTFQIRLLGPALATGLVTGAKAYSLWRVGRYIIERNIIDQIPHPLKSNPGNNILKEGILLGGSHLGWQQSPPILAPFIFPLALVRRNVIQHVDQKVPPLGLTERSLWFQSAETAITEKNVLSIHYLHAGTSIVPYAVENGSGFIKMWENQTPDNKPVEIYAISVTGSPLQFKNSLRTDAEMAVVLAL